MTHHPRTMEREDLNAALALVNRSLAFDQVTASLLNEKIWEDAQFDPKLALVVEADGCLIGLAIAVMRRNSESLRGYIKLIAVDPDHRKQGIGTSLLDALEKILLPRTKWILLGESAPNYLWPGLDPRYTDAMVFFEKRGYNRYSDTSNLSVDLLSLPQIPPSPVGMNIRRARPEDRMACREFVMDKWYEWLPEVTQAFANDPISLHLAFVDEQLIAFAGYDCNNRGTGWFGPMATGPRYRRKGLGRTLLLHCLADMVDQGLERAVIPWVGPVAFYNRAVGAVVDRVFYRMDKRSD